MAAAGYAVTALLTRQGSPLTRTIWAEDGREFLTPAYRDSSPGAWLQSYTGYLHLLPRMIAALVAHLPVGQASFWLAVLSTLIGVGCLVLLALGLKPWLPQTWMQAALVVAIASIRGLASEPAANIANLHWYATLGLVGLVLLPVRHWGWSALAAVAALLLGLTDAFAVPMMLPALLVLVVRLVVQRRAALRSLPITLGLAVAAAAQVMTTLRAPRNIHPMHHYHPADTFRPYISFVLKDNVDAVRLSSALLLAHVALVLVAVAVAAAVRFRSPVRESRTARLEPTRLAVGLALLVASPLIFAVDVLTNQYVASRYAALPASLLVTGVVVLVAGVRPTHRVLVGLLTGGLIVTALLAWNVNFDWRGTGPDYPTQLPAARATCATGKPVARVPTSPNVYFADGSPKWYLDIPCSKFGH